MLYTDLQAGEIEREREREREKERERTASMCQAMKGL